VLNASHHLLGDGAFIFFSRYKIISPGSRAETLYAYLSAHVEL
jgi:hypothetical protein